jgi:branched-chain amino acid aminotransferase
MPLACLDGEIRALDEVAIPVTDEGLLRGDGVFEVVRLYRGRPFALAEHLRRLERSAANLRLPVEPERIRADALALIERAGAVDAILRLVVTRGGRRLAMIQPLPEPLPSAALALVEYAPTRTLDGIKSLSYAANMLATRLARERGADEALLVTPHGRLLEGPTASFFCVLDGELVTPPLDDHILDSITRQRLLALCGVRERSLSREDIARMDEAFLASTTREVLPVRAIEGRELPAPGPRTRQAARALREHIASELA